MRALLIVALVCVVPAVTACGDDPPEPFDTYQQCFDKFAPPFGTLPVIETIVKCCMDHPIDGVQPACRGTTPDCIGYLTDNLNQTSAGFPERRDACDEYIVKQFETPPEE